MNKLFEKVLRLKEFVVFRGISGKQWNDNEKRPYCNCYSFWTPDIEYAKLFGSQILKRDINHKNFFDLDDKESVEDYKNEMMSDPTPAEQNLEFAAWLVLNDYEGYTRLDLDEDDDDTENANREYVIINETEFELRQEINKLLDDVKWEFSKSDASDCVNVEIERDGKTCKEELFLYNDFTPRKFTSLLSKVGHKELIGFSLSKYMYKDLEKKMIEFGLDPNKYRL